jgi:hypothetical protein
MAGRGMRIGLVGCVKSKRPTACAARDLYSSPLFLGRRRWVERTCDEWFVLSAKHGLLQPEEVIEPYDVSLVDAPVDVRRSWARSVIEALRQQLGDLSSVTFEVHAGSAYRDHGLVADLRYAGAAVEIPAKGLAQGDQLAFYAGTSDDQEDSMSGRSAYSPLNRWLGARPDATAELTFRRIEEILGRALPQSAQSYREWWANTAQSPQGRAWLDAGWTVSDVSLNGRRVTLQRRKSVEQTASVDADEAIRLLSDESRAIAVGELDRSTLRSAGLYSWWADDEARAIFSSMLAIDVAPLVYAGQTGATKWPSGRGSDATLAGRLLGQHARGAISASTFRLTLAALLREQLGLRTAASGDLEPESNDRLTEWIAAHLCVIALPVDDRETLGVLEATVVAALDPPLNLEHVATTPWRRRLSELRRGVRSQPGALVPRPAGPVEIVDESGSWLLRIEPITTDLRAAPSTASPTAAMALGGLAQHLPAVHAALRESTTLRVAFSPEVRRALQRGQLQLMQTASGAMPTAVDAAGRVAGHARVVAGGAGGTAVVAAGAPMWPIALAAAAGLAAATAEQRWLERTFADLQAAVNRVEHRLRDDDAGALEAADRLVALVARDGSTTVAPQLRLELAAARQRVESVYLSRRRFVERFKKALETEQTAHEARTGERTAWVGDTAAELADRRTGVVDELVLFIQAMIARARLAALTAAVLAQETAGGDALALIEQTAMETRRDYYDLHNRVRALTRSGPEASGVRRLMEIAKQRVPLLGGADDESAVLALRALEAAMSSTVGDALPDRDDELVIDVLVEPAALEPAQAMSLQGASTILP